MKHYIIKNMILISVLSSTVAIVAIVPEEEYEYTASEHQEEMEGTSQGGKIKGRLFEGGRHQFGGGYREPGQEPVEFSAEYADQPVSQEFDVSDDDGMMYAMPFDVGE